MNQGTHSRSGTPPRSGRTGQMTAVMRALPPAPGPKVLRIGLVMGGRIVEERVVKRRTSVTLGSDEKSMFVVQANVPSRFKLFELIHGDYYLNFLDGMTGRVALATGIADLEALSGQARRIGPAYRVPLTEEARGKIVVGATTFLFQFVAPPAPQQRPRLPLSVKGGLGSRIDWGLTVIAAFSFLVHFGVVGAMYSDWTDPVVDDGLTAGLLEMVQKTSPAAVETYEAPASTAASAESATEPTPPSRSRPRAQPQVRSPGAQSVHDAVIEGERTRIAILTALNALGPALTTALKDDAVAPVNLNILANKPDGVENASGGNLSMPGAEGPFRPGKTCEGLQCVHVETVAATSTAGPAVTVVPVDVQYAAPTISVPVSNAEATIRRQIHPGAKRCYQRGLQQDPTQAGRLVITIKVAPGGDVDSASVASNGGLSAQVASCIALVARRAKFDAPGPDGSTISVPFNFVKQGAP